MKFDIFGFLKANRTSCTITSINVKLHGYTHNLKGMDVNAMRFTVDIPFRNKTHTDMLTESGSFKPQKAEPMTIKGMTIAEPFKLVSMQPTLPITIDSDKKVDFKIIVDAPEHDYTGPMNISFLSDEIEMVHVEISKTILEAKGRRIPIEVSSRILNLPKGQIFTEKIQLYKAFSYGDQVAKIEIAEPFKFVSSEPKLPLKIDDTNSYIVNLYIQAPQSQYAGTLDIRLS